MESRFGHDFGKVRVHRDGKAADSATAVQARAYTVGHEIVLGSAAAGLGRRGTVSLLGHELSHVVQQERAFLSSGHPGVLQRSGLEVPNDTQGQASSASNGPENQAAGLSEPDCDTRVADVFLLGRFTVPSDRNAVSPRCMIGTIETSRAFFVQTINWKANRTATMATRNTTTSGWRTNGEFSRSPPRR